MICLVRSIPLQAPGDGLLHNLTALVWGVTPHLGNILKRDSGVDGGEFGVGRGAWEIPCRGDAHENTDLRAQCCGRADAKGHEAS